MYYTAQVRYLEEFFALVSVIHTFFFLNVTMYTSVAGCLRGQTQGYRLGHDIGTITYIIKLYL